MSLVQFYQKDFLAVHHFSQVKSAFGRNKHLAYVVVRKKGVYFVERGFYPLVPRMRSERIKAYEILPTNRVLHFFHYLVPQLRVREKKRKLRERQIVFNKSDEGVFEHVLAASHNSATPYFLKCLHQSARYARRRNIIQAFKRIEADRPQRVGWVNQD